MSGALDLIVVVVQACDMGPRELGNLSGWSTDTATDVENLHTVRDADTVGEVVLVPGGGLVEALADGIPAEVKGLAPAIFVKVGGEIVVSGRC